MRLLLNVIFVLALGIAPALAQDAADKTADNTATPSAGSNRNNTMQEIRIENCDFSITLPGEPGTAHRCDPENPAKCSKILTYTKVYGLDATAMFNISCNPAEDGMYERYSTDVMKSTLQAMVGKGTLTQSETDAVENDNFKHAIVVGTGKEGEQDRLYSAQLWIGHSSVFTVEGEIVGFAGDEADKMFADVMSSVKYTGPVAKTADKSGDKAEDTAEKGGKADMKKEKGAE
jgi:hypothetical protein